MKAALKKEQTKSASLEMSLQQKVCLLWKQFQPFLMYERDWETVSKKAGAGSEWVARAQGWLWRGRLGSRQVSALRPSPPYAGGIWKRGFTLKTHQIFSVHTLTVTGHVGFIFGETRSGNPIIIMTSSFSKSSVSNFFPSAIKHKVGFFKFLRFQERFSSGSEIASCPSWNFIAMQMRKINREKGYLQGHMIL